MNAAATTPARGAAAQPGNTHLEVTMKHTTSTFTRVSLLQALALVAVAACGGKETGDPASTTTSDSGGNGGSTSNTASGGSTGESASAGGATTSGGTTDAAGGTSSTSATSAVTSTATAADANTSGTTSGTTGTGGVGGGGQTGVVETLEGPCDTPGALACAGNYQKLTLVCGADGAWGTNETCGDGAFCDSTPGVNQGICRAAYTGCEGREPGFQLCDGNALVECSPDTVNVEVIEQCDGECVNAACVAAREPCPEGGQLLDCAGDCDPEGLCSSAPCPLAPALILSEATTNVVRVPDYEDLCVAPCNSSIHVLGLMIPGQWFIRAVIPPPWRLVANVTLNDNAACTNQAVEGCAIFDLANVLDFYIFTDDPSARASNVLFEVVDEGATCP